MGRERMSADDAFGNVIDATARTVGDSFHQVLVERLCAVTGCRIAFVGEAIGDGLTRVRTRAVWMGDALADDFEYDLAGTPCANVVGGTTCFHPRAVRALFPDDLLLGEMGVESYLATPIVAADGSPLGLVALLHDQPRDDLESFIPLLSVFSKRVAAEMERQRAENALRESEHRLRLIVENAPALVWTTDDALRITYAAGGAARLLGVDIAHVLGASLHEIFDTDDPEVLPIAMHHGALGGTSGQFHLPRGEHVFQAYVEPLRNDDGTISGVLGVAFDISGAVRAAETEEMYRTLFDEIPAGIGVADASGTLVDVNQAMLQIGGYPDKQTALETEVEAFYADASERQRLVADVRNEGRVSEREVPLRRYDGSVFPALVSVAPVHVSGRMCTLAVIEDLTARRKLEAQVLHAQKLESLGAFAGGMAHDFNNLLTTILGNAGLAMSELPAESRGREMLGDIIGAAKEAAGLTKQMLAYAGRNTLDVAPLRLDEVVRDMAHLLRVAVSDGGTLNLQLTEAGMRGDVAQLRELITNLVCNASEALEDGGGEIVICTGIRGADATYLASPYVPVPPPPGPYAFIEVRDTGCGMTDETMSRIFDPFYTTKLPGRGLGLAAVLGAVVAHRGTVKVSSAPGRGTSVEILFPHAADVGNARGDVVERRPRILVIDDDAGIRIVAKRILTGSGFDVVVADGGAAGLAEVDAGDDFDAVLLDLMMPGMNGDECLRGLRKMTDAPVVIMSGYSEREVLQALPDAGATDYLMKPFGAASLVAMMQRVLDVGPMADPTER